MYTISLRFSFRIAFSDSSPSICGTTIKLNRINIIHSDNEILIVRDCEYLSRKEKNKLSQNKQKLLSELRLGGHDVVVDRFLKQKIQSTANAEGSSRH